MNKTKRNLVIINKLDSEMMGTYNTIRPETTQHKIFNNTLNIICASCGVDFLEVSK